MFIVCVTSYTTSLTKLISLRSYSWVKFSGNVSYHYRKQKEVVLIRILVYYYQLLQYQLVQHLSWEQEISHDVITPISSVRNTRFWGFVRTPKPRAPAHSVGRESPIDSGVIHPHNPSSAAPCGGAKVPVGLVDLKVDLVDLKVNQTADLDGGLGDQTVNCVARRWTWTADLDGELGGWVARRLTTRWTSP